MQFDWFVLPFTIGLTYLLCILFYKTAISIVNLPKEDKQRLSSLIKSKKIFSAIREIFSESLFHRKIFRTNPVLGYMHMSLAFGWFMLIVIGNLESKLYSPELLNPPYYPIFFKYFEPRPHIFLFARGFNILMDFFLLFTLSGVLLAWIKRIKPGIVGMKRITKHNRFDRTALTALWFIFPMRLLAESSSAAINHNGDFLTGTLGNFFASFLLIHRFEYVTWWAYSLALGTFFVALPYSRYMHIPAEVGLIFLRHAGVRSNRKANSLTTAEINACSRCGICIDSCQLASAAAVTDIQPSYFIRDVRYKQLQPATSYNCLMCGRCNNACPVGIDSINLRQIERDNYAKESFSNFNYLSTETPAIAPILYFAGCMTHLTPGIKNSMVNIFEKADIQYSFLDENGSICCGRPLMLAGQVDAAHQLMKANIELIHASGAKTLVTSCPICLKVFREEYKLDIEVLHHSQYLLRLIDTGKIALRKSDTKVVYHDPCELGRGQGIYLEPRAVINHVAELQLSVYEFENSLCCGGSLANTKLSYDQKNAIARDALKRMGVGNADTLVTACPLCKKTFAKVSEIPTLDIAQLVEGSMISITEEPKISARKPIEEKIIVN